MSSASIVALVRVSRRTAVPRQIPGSLSEAVPLRGSTAFVFGWEMGFGIATAKATELVCCDQCLRRLAVTDAALARELKQAVGEGDREAQASP